MPYICDIRELRNMTAYEISDVIAAGKQREIRRARENELLAFNIAALVLTAFNAPMMFPSDPDSAFRHKRRVIPEDGGKAAFMALADRINGRYGCDRAGR